MSRQLCLSDDKGDNEMILGAVHRSPGICLTAEKNPSKPQLGDRRSHRLKWGPLLETTFYLDVHVNKYY